VAALILLVAYVLVMARELMCCPYRCPCCGHYGPAAVCEYCGYDQRAGGAAVTGNVASEDDDER
jgi:hypothetical protein